MFSKDQEKKIKVFATITKLSNICFEKCVEIDNLQNSTIQNDKNNKNFNSAFSINKDLDLPQHEKECLKKCSDAFMEINHNVHNQLFTDYNYVKEENKYIFDNKT